MLRNRFVSSLVALSALCAFSVSAMAQGTTKPGDKKPADAGKPAPVSKMAPAGKPGEKKAGPARDPKTGRFVKKDAGKK